MIARGPRDGMVYRTDVSDIFLSNPPDLVGVGSIALPLCYDVAVSRLGPRTPLFFIPPQPIN